MGVKGLTIHSKHHPSGRVIAILLCLIPFLVMPSHRKALVNPPRGAFGMEQDSSGNKSESFSLKPSQSVIACAVDYRIGPDFLL